MTLIFTQVFLLLSLFGIKQAGLSYKSAHSAWRQQLAEDSAQLALTDIEKNIFRKDIQCLISVTPVTLLIKKPLDWWQSTACGGKTANLRYYYVIEYMGHDACALPQPVEEYRLTLYANASLNHGVRVVMQSVVALKGSPKEECHDLPHTMNLGEQMRHLVG